MYCLANSRDQDGPAGAHGIAGDGIRTGDTIETLSGDTTALDRPGVAVGPPVVLEQDRPAGAHSIASKRGGGTRATDASEAFIGDGTGLSLPGVAVDHSHDRPVCAHGIAGAGSRAGNAVEGAATNGLARPVAAISRFQNLPTSTHGVAVAGTRAGDAIEAAATDGLTRPGACGSERGGNVNKGVYQKHSHGSRDHDEDRHGQDTF